MKKLIPALCMLLIAAALMGTSTFAWFSMNTEVTATGMAVKASTSKNLVIAGTDNNFGTSTNKVTAAATSMFPATSQDGKAFYSTSTAAVDYNTSTLKTGATFTSQSNSGTYFYQTTLQVKSESSDLSFNKFKVAAIKVKYNGSEIQNNASAAELAKSLRVSVTFNSETKIYAPVSGYTSAYKSINSAGNAIGDVDVTLANYDATWATASIGNTAKDVVVNIWFEGQDAACTSANAAVPTSNFEFEFAFQAE